MNRRGFLKAAGAAMVAGLILPEQPERRFWQLDQTMAQPHKYPFGIDDLGVTPMPDAMGTIIAPGFHVGNFEYLDDGTMLIHDARLYEVSIVRDTRQGWMLDGLRRGFE